MQRILTKLHLQISKLCKPTPKLNPDPSIRQNIWNRNLMNFYSLSFFNIFFIVFSSVSKFPFNLNLLICASHFFQLLFLVIFCRSYLWIFNISFMIINVTVEYIGLEINPEATYFHIGHCFLLILSTLIITGDGWITCCTGVLEIIVSLTRFKEKFIIVLKEEEPEVFAEKFVKITILFYFVVMIIFNIPLVKTLEKRTIELCRAKTIIENALEQQKTFIFSFSHELRNPINSLLGNLQLVLQGEKLSTKASEMINIAKICGEILLHNINNVLDTGKHEIGKLEVNPMPTPLSELFQRTWGIYSELFRQKKLKSQLRIEKDIPPVVKVDSHKVNQVLLNLIGNSIKFTEKGSVTVTIKWDKGSEVCDKCFDPIPYDDVDEGLFEKEENLSTLGISKISESKPGFLRLNGNGRDSNRNHSHSQQQGQESKGILKIIVKDTGFGMKPEALNKLFQKFSQVSEDISQRQIGTGLGLFITREICHAMKGEIRAYSKFGIGTTFVVCIPAVSLPLNNLQRADSEAIIHQLSTKHIKALVADDSPFNVSLTCNYLSQFGASVASVAYNGYDAFRNFKQCRINNIDVDIVTLDIDMPIMDGRKVCDRIREYEKENQLKPVMIILISGNYDQDQIEEYLSPERGHKADCFLRKPVSFSEFNRAVYSLVVRN